MSGNKINFDGQVAIVTGAGAGLGEAYALDLASRGAKILVNDLSEEAAAKVVSQIEAAGGQAMAFAASVSDEAAMQDMIAKAVEAWGRVDIFVANAGILIDRSFSKMTMAEYDKVIDVHLRGTVCGLKAVWPQMIEQNYGRIVVTTSVAGLFGNFGQTNYGSAKSGLVGLMNTLKIEGEKSGIKVNAISPGAATQMTENIIPEPLKETMSASRVAPAVTVLCSEDAPSGVILQANGGIFSVAQMVLTRGAHLKGDIQAEDVQAAWDEITNPEGQSNFATANDQGADFFGRISGG